MKICSKSLKISFINILLYLCSTGFWLIHIYIIYSIYVSITQINDLTASCKLFYPNRTHEELGSGQFGIVYRSVWQQTANPEDTGLGVEVAVKTMEEGASEEERVKFLQEAAIMGQFKNHPNILRILGIVLDTPVSYSSIITNYTDINFDRD